MQDKEEIKSITKILKRINRGNILFNNNFSFSGGGHKLVNAVKLQKERKE
jgi:hypothetical protein